MNNKTINGCPYKSSYSGQCSHKGTKPNRKCKRYCGHEYPHNCDLFMQWLEIKESCIRTRLSSLQAYHRCEKTN